MLASKPGHTYQGKWSCGFGHAGVCTTYCIRIYTRMYLCMYVRTYVRTYVHTQPYNFEHTNIFSLISACIAKYVHTLIRLHDIGRPPSGMVPWAQNEL